MVCESEMKTSNQHYLREIGSVLSEISEDISFYVVQTLLVTYRSNIMIVRHSSHESMSILAASRRQVRSG